jgi:large subunit ribosomal protein L18
MNKNKVSQRNRRHARIRSRVFGTKERPRLSVFRSSAYMYAQLIDDDKGVTLLAKTNHAKLAKKVKAGTKVEIARNLGMAIAKDALDKKIKKVVFDRGGFQYHGRVKAFAEGAREGGLEF